jgi:hypothetical protein
MPMEVIVGPAMRASNRWPPKRLTKNAADHTAGHGANRTGNQKAGSGAGAGADPIGACRRCGDSRGGHKRSRRQQKFFHLVRPDSIRRLRRATHAVNRPVKTESLISSWQSSGGF